MVKYFFPIFTGFWEKRLSFHQHLYRIQFSYLRGHAYYLVLYYVFTVPSALWALRKNAVTSLLYMVIGAMFWSHSQMVDHFWIALGWRDGSKVSGHGILVFSSEKWSLGCKPQRGVTEVVVDSKFKYPLVTTLRKKVERSKARFLAQRVTGEGRLLCWKGDCREAKTRASYWRASWVQPLELKGKHFTCMLCFVLIKVKRPRKEFISFSQRW